MHSSFPRPPERLIRDFRTDFRPDRDAYPTRLDNFSRHPTLRNGFTAMTILWVGTLLWMLVQYPQPNPVLLVFSLAYCLTYFAISLHCTFRAP